MVLFNYLLLNDKKHQNVFFRYFLQFFFLYKNIY